MKLDKSFMGYRRENGRVGIRNHVVIMPLDDISNAAAEAVASHIQGTRAIPHAYGRLQFGEDLELFFRTIIGTCANPNVAACVVIGIEDQWTNKVVQGVKALGREKVLKLHPVGKERPAVMVAELKVPAQGQPKLHIDVASHEQGDFVLKVFVADKLAKEAVINTKGKWAAEVIDLAVHAGKTVPVRIEAHSNDWHWEAAFFGKVEIR